ncbi:MAG: hypothetical protein B7Z82_08460 [Halothiobacillus sp. 20-54-6]|nr:MAG: hypothetical protein B7Z82_08460 [Halothiobacillus sp. 20-54-6]
MCPDYRAPAVPVPSNWQAARLTSGPEPVSAKANAAELTHWWQAFHDPVLTRLIQWALANNKDVKQTEGRLKEARARRAISQADQYPSLARKAARMDPIEALRHE